MTTLHIAAALPDDHNKLLSPGLTNVVCRILSTLQATEIHTCGACLQSIFINISSF